MPCLIVHLVVHINTNRLTWVNSSVFFEQTSHIFEVAFKHEKKSAKLFGECEWTCTFTYDILYHDEKEKENSVRHPTPHPSWTNAGKNLQVTCWSKIYQNKGVNPIMRGHVMVGLKRQDYEINLP